MSDIEKHGDGDTHISEFELCHYPEEVLRIGRDFQRQDTFRGAQHDTVKLLCDTIEYLRDSLSKAVGSAAAMREFAEYVANYPTCFGCNGQMDSRFCEACPKGVALAPLVLKARLAISAPQTVHNSKATREALTDICRGLEMKIKDRPASVTSHEMAIYKRCKAALSEPARNCDFYDNKTDAETRFVEETGENDMSQHYWQMFAIWLLAQAAERKEDAR